MNKNKGILIEYAYFVCLMAIALILAFCSRLTNAVTEGISLWATCVLPGAFPFAVITALLSSLSVTGKISNRFSPLTKRAFRINGAVSYAFFMSLLAGYPLGATLVGNLKEKGVLSNAESVRASVLCSTSSLTFTMVSVGNIMFNDALFGVGLFLCHILSTIFVAIIFSFYKRKERPTEFTPTISVKTDNVFYESIYSSALSIIAVGGIITVFCLLTELLLTFHVLDPVIFLLSSVVGKTNGKAITVGAFECTKGLKILSSANLSIFSLPIACAIVSFGGLSVIVQSTAFLKKAKIKTAPFILSKVFSAVLSFLFGLIFSFIFY